MMSLSAVKQLTISLGLYRQARALHRMLTGANMSGHRQLLSQFVRSGDLAFDVGANVGHRTELMLDLGARVVAFEPQPQLAREIRARGGSSKSLIVKEFALGAEPANADLFLTTSTGMASLNPQWDRSKIKGKLTVPVSTLDLEIAEHGVPAFCKIDVEGFEVEVLLGLSQALPALSIEFHRDQKGVAKIHECLRILTGLGSYKFNLIGTEESRWLLDSWLGPDEFLTAFPACAEPHEYGDIFAKRI